MRSYVDIGLDAITPWHVATTTGDESAAPSHLAGVIGAVWGCGIGATIGYITATRTERVGRGVVGGLLGSPIGFLAMHLAVR